MVFARRTVYKLTWHKRQKRTSTLHDSFLSGYKEGNVYSVISNKWLHDMLYNDIEPQSIIYFVKAYGTPSQAVNNVPHTACLTH